MVTLGLVQMSMSADPAANLKKAAEKIAEAAGKGANIVVLPELFLLPYFCQHKGDTSAFTRAEPIPGPTTATLAEIAQKQRIVLIGGSIFEKADGRYFNTSPLFGPDGKLLGTYRKTHIPHDPDFYEQEYFAPGDTGVRVFATPFGNVAPLICYDQWFPEAARLATLKGAELIVYPTAIAEAENVPPVDPAIPEDWSAMWRAVQVGHAAANNVYVAAVNRVGTEGKMHFWGGSFVANPGGLVIAEAGDQEGTLLVTLDLGYVAKMQKSWRFLDGRKPSLYGDLSS
jgi:predicted amidohydrolase